MIARKVFSLVLVALLCMVSIAALSGSSRNGKTQSESQALNGAYRDGYFLGSFMAERGEGYRPTSGRWSARADRAAFLEGYQDGYSGAQELSAQK